MRHDQFSPEEHPVPIHDWTRVDAGIFHAFHHDWITELARALNRGLLPADYYALPEQHAAGFGPDVLTFQEENDNGATDPAFTVPPATGGLLLTAPKLQPIAETDLAFYPPKQHSTTFPPPTPYRPPPIFHPVPPPTNPSPTPL